MGKEDRGGQSGSLWVTGTPLGSFKPRGSYFKSDASPHLNLTIPWSLPRGGVISDEIQDPLSPLITPRNMHPKGPKCLIPCEKQGL